MRLRVKFTETDVLLRVFSNDNQDKICYARATIPIETLKNESGDVRDALLDHAEVAKESLARALGL